MAQRGFNGTARVALRLWHSATVTTWSSTAARSLSVLVVLPLLLRQLTPAEVAVWYLLTTVIALQSLADLGFAPTFVRLISYAMAGGEGPAGVGKTTNSARHAEPDWDRIESIWSSMRVIYRRITWLAVLIVGAVGTSALVKPIDALPDPDRGWAAWIVVLAVSACVLWSNMLAAYLQGLNEVALLRRWEVMTSLAAMVTSIVVLLLGGRLLALVVANQAWVIVNVFRNWQLARHVAGGRFKAFKDVGMDRTVFDSAWPAAWRSGLGVLLARGVVHSSGLIYAQVAQPAALSTYLLSFRAAQLLNELAIAPFASKLPTLARLRAAGDFDQQLRAARRAMRLAYWTFVLGFVFIGLTASPLVGRIGSQVEFADARLWALLGVGFFLERYGAMHIQLYSTTNHIVWHVAAGVTGALYLVISLALLDRLGAEAFPVALIAANLGFYCWYCATRVYRMFEVGFLRFEATTLLPPALVVAVFAVSAFLH